MQDIKWLIKNYGYLILIFLIVIIAGGDILGKITHRR